MSTIEERADVLAYICWEQKIRIRKNWVEIFLIGRVGNFYGGFFRSGLALHTSWQWAGWSDGGNGFSVVGDVVSFDRLIEA